LNSVFSSPAANSGAKFFSQTPWCRWMTSTRGTLPSLRTRFGRKPVIQPSTGGLNVFSSIEIVFWPGEILTGPYSKWSVSSAAAGAANSSTARSAAIETRMIMTRRQS
jgi:hypothetical protein